VQWGGRKRGKRWIVRAHPSTLQVFGGGREKKKQSKGSDRNQNGNWAEVRTVMEVVRVAKR